MNLQDAIYNWLSIKKVAEERPDDYAAQDTYQFFDQILREDHQLKDIRVSTDGPWYKVYYRLNEKEDMKQYPVELVDALLESILSEPKYN